MYIIVVCIKKIDTTNLYLKKVIQKFYVTKSHISMLKSGNSLRKQNTRSENKKTNGALK